jgi:hypothetical protein
VGRDGVVIGKKITRRVARRFGQPNEQTRLAPAILDVVEGMFTTVNVNVATEAASFSIGWRQRSARLGT